MTAGCRCVNKYVVSPERMAVSSCFTNAVAFSGAGFGAVRVGEIASDGFALTKTLVVLLPQPATAPAMPMTTAKMPSTIATIAMILFVLSVEDVPGCVIVVHCLRTTRGR